MRHANLLVLLICAVGLGLLAPLTGIAAEDTGGKAVPGDSGVPGDRVAASVGTDQREGAELPKEMPVYKPPLRGAPGGRQGGGTRGDEGGSLTVSALVPDHTGLTSREHPSLYWFLSQPTNHPIELTVIEARAVQPILETRINQGAQPGVQCVRLADYGVRLKTGVPYQWFVVVVADPEQRSRDIIGGGEIERVDLDKALKTQLDQGKAADAPHRYAQAGIWYDALAVISERIDAAPQNTDLRKQRASLLRQVGLTEVADYEMKR